MSSQLVSPDEFNKIPYLDMSAVRGRLNVPILPYWDGENWHTWIPHERRLHLMHPLAAMDTAYVAKSAQREEDLRIPFVELMWQRGPFSHVGRHFRAICNDFRNLFTSVAKLKALHGLKAPNGRRMPQSFVSSEIEFMLTVSRSVYDLLYETIREVWHGTTLSATLKTPEKRLPDRLSKFLLGGQERRPRSADELVALYGVPTAFASAVERHSSFFSKVRTLRDSVVHGFGEPPTFFVLENGFGVSPKSQPFCDFPWAECHYYNDHVVSLLPWLAHLVLHTIEACNDIAHAFASEVAFPPEIAPGHMVFVRCETSPVVIELLAAYRNELVWWTGEGVPS